MAEIVPAIVKNTSQQEITLRAQPRPGFFNQDQNLLLSIGASIELTSSQYELVKNDVEQLARINFVEIVQLADVCFDPAASLLQNVADLNPDRFLTEPLTKGPTVEVEIRAPWLTLETRTIDPLPSQGAPDGSMWFIQGPTTIDPVDVRVRLNGTVYSLLGSINGSNLITVLLQLMMVVDETLQGVNDGINQSFLTASAFETTTFTVSVNGHQQPKSAYSLDESVPTAGFDTVIFNSPPPIGAIIDADYFRLVTDYFP